MKIAIEAQRIFRKNKHGMDFVALESIKELQKIDKKNQYYILVAPGEDKCLKETGNFKIIEFGSTFYPCWEQFNLPRELKKIKPDILHCTSNTAPFFCSVPLILTLHDIIFLEPRGSKNKSLYQNLGWYYRKLIVPKILPKCNKIITVSSFECKRIKESLKLSASRKYAPKCIRVRSFFLLYNPSQFLIPDQYLYHTQKSGISPPLKNHFLPSFTNTISS